ncbi:uncharacterized protein LOC134024004 isoform X1 [Osmerus eperlanus]|uniref:uncharacterized protein LOC134024004 isoform X1 n=1 Tax=Osmerus eperlanus TaxID=29151 RepID=UPI002E139960
MYGQTQHRGTSYCHHRHLGTLGTAILRQWEDEEEEEHVTWSAEHSTFSCCSRGCHDVPNYIITESCQDESSWQWAVTDSQSVAFHHQIVNTQNQLDIGQEFTGIWMVDNPPHQPVRGNSFYHSFNNSFGDQGVQGYGCVCFPGPSLPGRWGGYPLFSHGLKKTFVVGLEVDIVEEVAFEDTEMLEVMPEGMLPNDIEEPILVHSDQLFLS